MGVLEAEFYAEEIPNHDFLLYLAWFRLYKPISEGGFGIFSENWKKEGFL